MTDQTSQNVNNDEEIFNKIDQEKITEEIKQQAVKEAQEALISKLTGGSKPKYGWEEKGKKAPTDYDELFEEVEKRGIKEDDARRIAREEAKKAQEELEEQRLKQEEEARKKQAESQKERAEGFDREWYQLVKEGKMPSPAKELQERINKGEALTKDEILADEGLKARLDLLKFASSGRKSAKLAYYEDFNKEPAGKNAPVIGSRPRSPQTEDKEIQYEDTAKLRKKMFGF